MQEEEKQNQEVIKNLVYASLILFYNLLLQKFSKTDSKNEAHISAQQKSTMEELIECLNDHIMDHFEDNMIVNVVLHLVTLFTKHSETASILFGNKKILAYIFNKLKYCGNGSLIGALFNKHGGTLPEKHQ
jgi:hypothetical protein